ncbi:multiple cyclophane-containing RiPP AmcA [Streptomyces sp. NPDC056716]
MILGTTWDNRPTWDNWAKNPAPFDNRPTWDNWNKKT